MRDSDEVSWQGLASVSTEKTLICQLARNTRTYELTLLFVYVPFRDPYFYGHSASSSGRRERNGRHAL
jgi:hypothetical protein